MLELLSTTSRIALSLFIIAAPSIAMADGSFSITGTSSDEQTVTGDDTGVVNSGATLTGPSGDPAILWKGTDSGTVQITNNGTINASSGDRDIQTSGSGDTDNSFSLINTGTMMTGSNDVFKISFGTAGTISIQNSGSMTSTGGQVFDFDSVTANVVNISNTGTIQSTGADAILTGDAGTINITNSGKISGNTTSDSGNRGIDIDGNEDDGPRQYLITNQAGGLIESDDDAVRIKFDVTGGSVTVRNSGTIHSFEGQAIDFDNIDNASGDAAINIINTATGVIRAEEADGIRPGGNATVTNYGQIYGESTTFDSSDGVDFQAHGGTVINESGGLIEGAHTGVTGSGGVNTINEKGGIIRGLDGSGINYDGDGTLVNYGTISGNFTPGSTDGDGDGVDIDGKTGDLSDTVQIYNYGTITALGATGTHDGGVNRADGIASGGGILYNGVGATITSVDRGVFVDDSNGGAAFAASTITNLGTIESTNDNITLNGTWNDTIINAGSIISQNGMAIQMGGGDDTLEIYAGSTIVGGIDGGDDNDTIILEGGNDAFSRSDITNFENLEVKNGIWTVGGTQTYSTGVTVDDTATLIETGTLNSTVTVDSGGTLAGNGTIGGLVALDGALVTPSGGTSTVTPGTTLNVAGDVEFDSGSTYKVVMNAAGETDSIVATGAADLNGNLSVTSSDGFKLGTVYTVLTADGGLTGAFTVDQNAPRLIFTATNNGNDVDVVAQLSGVSFSDLANGGGQNQQKIADALDKASDAGQQSDLLNILNGLDVNDLNKAMNSLSGVSHASITSLSMQTSSQFGQAVSDRIGSLRSGDTQTSSVDSFSGMQVATQNIASSLNSELAALCNTDQTSNVVRGIANDFWLRGYGSFGRQDGANNVSGYSYQTGGFAAGYDHHLSEDFLAGVSIGYSKTTADFDGSTDRATINSYDVGLYGSYDTGSFYIDGIVNYSLLDNKSQRDIDLGGTTDHAQSNYNGDRVVAYGETGYVFKFGDTSLQPLGSLQYTWLGQDSFKEHGAGSADLTADSSNMNSLKSGLGVRLSHRFQTGDNMFFTPEVRARWSHEFLDDQSSTQTGFADLPGSNFTVKGIRTSRDAALVGAGLTADITSSLAMVIDYDAYVSPDQTVHNISGGFKVKW